MIYFEGFNEFGIKGGSNNYMIDLSYEVSPNFLTNSNLLNISIDNDQDEKLKFDLFNSKKDFPEFQNNYNFTNLSASIISINCYG